MRAVVLACLALVCAAPAAAQTGVHETLEEWSEPAAARFVSPALAQAERAAIAAYGPFRVLDDGTAALVDVTDERSPAAFQAMLRDHPDLATLRFVECPGTYDDRANLELGRLIRAAGLAAEVPAGGSVRSGAVELVLAGTRVSIADGAEFAVHAWLDEDGLSAADYAPDSPAHAKYLAYYREMGMDGDHAARFYAMTNAVPFEDARWLSGAEMRRWIDREPDAPRLAYLDLGPALN
ncbi:MAG TPA: alpha/beta hydrolase [Croceibacterium sp.]|nr:alpha/beta hydrolase [Croceibacterium sp.]